MSARESGSASGSAPLLPDEYESLITRVRESANTVIPRNATVLVVSRGDEELLRLGPRRALHFPQDEFGRYAGYHPEDSDSAIAALEDMRARGAQFLLLPNTAFWWLDYYDGLREYLETNHPPVLAADDCMIFDLGAGAVQSGSAGADTGAVSVAMSSRRVTGPLDELLRALLPLDARVAVVGGTGRDLPSFADSTPLEPPSNSAATSAVLDQAGAARAEFLVVPVNLYERVHGETEPGDSLHGWKLVTRQRHLCEVYERPDAYEPLEAQETADEPVTAAAGTVTAAAARPAGGGSPAARPSLWQRVRSWFGKG